jgi:plastocyanin
VVDTNANPRERVGMTALHRGLAVSLMAFVLGAGLPAAAKPTPAQKCTGAKMKAAAKKVSGKLACYAKAASKNLPVDSACLDNAGTAFTTAVSKAELKGGCPTVTDVRTVEGTIDVFVQSEASAVPRGGTKDSGKCASSKLKAAGINAMAKLLCNAKAAIKSIAVDPACLNKADVNLTKAFSKAEKKGGCVTTNDAMTVEQAVNPLVAQVVEQLTSAGSPTTTTTTTAGTTTTGSGSSTTTSPTTTTALTSTTMGGPTTHTVMVGPSGALVFDPATLPIHVGDTVKWVWASPGHSVVSGTVSGNPLMEMSDGKFCSPNDTNCGSFQLSDVGATYSHTFTTTGTFPYFCLPHGTLGMAGTIDVTP